VSESGGNKKGRPNKASVRAKQKPHKS